MLEEVGSARPITDVVTIMVVVVVAANDLENDGIVSNGYQHEKYKL